MSKNKKFQPPAGFVVGVHINIMAIKALAEQLNMNAYKLARACEKAGLMLQADIMDLSGDAAKVILIQERDKGKDTNADTTTP